MTKRVDHSNRAIADALRMAGSEPPFRGSLKTLTARIDAAAVPVLAARRLGQRPLMWWDFAAEWARMLIPAGLTVAAASAMMLWALRPLPPNMGLGRGGAPATDVIERTLDELMTTRATPPALRTP